MPFLDCRQGNGSRQSTRSRSALPNHRGAPSPPSSDPPADRRRRIRSRRRCVPENLAETAARRSSAAAGWRRSRARWDGDGGASLVRSRPFVGLPVLEGDSAPEQLVWAIGRADARSRYAAPGSRPGRRLSPRVRTPRTARCGTPFAVASRSGLGPRWAGHRRRRVFEPALARRRRGPSLPPVSPARVDVRRGSARLAAPLVALAETSAPPGAGDRAAGVRPGSPSGPRARPGGPLRGGGAGHPGQARRRRRGDGR